VDPKRTPPRGSIGPLPGAKGPLPGAKGAAAPGLRRPGAAGSQPAQPVRPSYQEALDQLARDIQQMKIEWDRYFGGGLPIPPEESRTRVQSHLRQLRNATMTGAADSFRLTTLEAQYNSYNELFNRRLRDREEGRQPVRKTALAEKPRFDPLQGITVGQRIESDAAEALYRGLATGGDIKFDLGSFQTYLARQVDAIRQKTGCEQVQFRLAEEDGKLKLKAKPVTR
jgi:hypothetical protein